MRQPDSLSFSKGWWWLMPFQKDIYFRCWLPKNQPPTMPLWESLFLKNMVCKIIISHLDPSSRKNSSTALLNCFPQGTLSHLLSTGLPTRLPWPLFAIPFWLPNHWDPFWPTGCNPVTWKNVNTLLFQLLPSNGMWDQRRHQCRPCIIGLGDTTCLHLDTWSECVAFRKQHVY